MEGSVSWAGPPFCLEKVYVWKKRISEGEEATRRKQDAQLKRKGGPREVSASWAGPPFRCEKVKCLKRRDGEANRNKKGSPMEVKRRPNKNKRAPNGGESPKEASVSSAGSPFRF